MTNKSEIQDRGVDALNRDFARFDQVDKPQVYRLSERSEVEEFDEEFVIRTCDLGQWLNGDEREREAFVGDFGAALREIGFAILINHGVEQSLYADAEAACQEFFESVPAAERVPYLAKRHGSVNQGYFPIRETTIIHPDMVEGWVFCRRAFNLDDDPAFDERAFWPRPGYEPVFRRLVKAQEALILPIMQAILAVLGCDRHLYDRQLTATNFGFRLNYYPATDRLAAAGAGGRMLGHEDVDLFTLLPAPAVEGLQVLNRRNMKWIRLYAPPGSIIINIGDYLQRISNDVLPSTTHRVSQPRSPEAMSRPRISLPTAVYVWEDEVLEVLPGLGAPKYPPVKAIHFHTRTTAKYYGAEYAVNEG